MAFGKFHESKTNNFLMVDYFQSFGFGTNISMPNGLLTLIYGMGSIGYLDQILLKKIN